MLIYFTYERDLTLHAPKLVTNAMIVKLLYLHTIIYSVAVADMFLVIQLRIRK